MCIRDSIWTEIEKLLMRAPAPSIGWEAGIHTRAMAQVIPEAMAQPRARVEAALDRAAELRAEMDHPGRATALMVATMLHRTTAQDAQTVLDRMKLFRLHDYPVRTRVLEAVTLWPQLEAALGTPEICALADQTEVLLVASVAWAATGRHEALGNIDRAVRLGVAEAPLPPLLTGRDLTKLGVAPGPLIGELLARLRAAQIAGEVSDKNTALTWVEQAWRDES